MVVFAAKLRDVFHYIRNIAKLK